MEVKYNLTGPARKALVKAIENITGEKAIYKKSPVLRLHGCRLHHHQGRYLTVG